MSLPRVLWLATLVVVSSSFWQETIADDEISKPTSALAREHLAKGTRHYRLREFEKAIDEYKAGVLVEDAPVFHYDLGQCYRQLGRSEDALWHYQRFLDRADPLPSQYKKAVEDFIRDLKADIAKHAAASPPAAPPLVVPPPPPAAAAPPPPRITVVDPPEPWYLDSFGWGLAGAGTLASGSAIWLLVDAKGLDDEANTASSQKEQVALRDRASQRRLAGVIVGVAGGLTLITGIVKLAITPEPRARTLDARSFDLELTPRGFAIAGRF